MPRRGENIRKRKDNRWEGRYISEYGIDGKAKYVSVYAKSYLEVKKKLSIAQSQNKKALPRTNEPISFREVLFLWLESSKIDFKEQTYSRYRYIIEAHIIPSFGAIKVTQITVEYINNFLSEKLKNGRLDGKGGLSVSYAQTISFVVYAAFNFAIDQKYCLPITGKSIKLTKNKKSIDVLTLEEQRVFEECLSQKIDIRKAAILLALYTGVRIGELCGLQWDDIDFTNRIIHIRRTIERIPNQNREAGDPKTKLIISDVKTETSDRFIPLSEKTIILLKKLRHTNSVFVLPGLSYPFMEPRTLQYSFKKYLKECNIKNIKFHALRHSFATRCMESGMDMKTLSEILGHSDVNITMMIYVHATIEHKREKIELMSTYCGQK